MNTTEERKQVNHYNNLCDNISQCLHEPDQEIGYRHYCVVLRKGDNNWKGKADLRM